MMPHPPGERSFGLSVGSVCLAAALLGVWRGRLAVAAPLLAVGILLVVCGYFASPVLRVPNRVWWRFAQALGWINARIILTVFFALVLTPVGVVMRMLGRNPLRVRDTRTNWSPARRRDARHYEHLF